MKTFITSILVVSLVMLPCHRAPAPTLPEAGIVIVVTVLAVGGIYKCHLASKRMNFYCVRDDDGLNGPKSCVAMKCPTKTAALNGWEIVSGPYPTGTQCDTNCWLTLPGVPPPPKSKASSGEDGFTFTIYQSPNCNGPWTSIIGTVTCKYEDDFEFDIDIPISQKSCFWKVIQENAANETKAHYFHKER